ncbi:MAG: hypothetical protein BEN18_05330 [Epulopiscium sp. Nuni2H_MBin001]|nr:MAG: hypothetical protein BEN18_05330 [Epulopiscium sp. Nuni2H_MBin001]
MEKKDEGKLVIIEEPAGFNPPAVNHDDNQTEITIIEPEIIDYEPIKDDNSPKPREVTLFSCILVSLVFGLGGIALIVWSLFSGASHYIGALSGYQVPAVGSIAQLMNKDIIISEYTLVEADTGSYTYTKYFFFPTTVEENRAHIQVMFGNGEVEDILVILTDDTYAKIDTKVNLTGALITRDIGDDKINVLVEKANILTLDPKWYLIAFIVIGLIGLAVTKIELTRYKKVKQAKNR